MVVVVFCRASVSAVTSAPAWLKAACLHRFLRRSEMEKIRQEIRQETDRQVRLDIRCVTQRFII